MAQQPSQASAEAGPATIRYGVGLRFNGLFIPRRAFERFVEVAPSGVSQPEVGIEVLRRKGTFESSLTLSVAALSPEDGIWLDEPDHNPSFVDFDGLAWISVDVKGVWVRAFDAHWALRYGMGIGAGFLLGEARETDYICPTGRYDLASCAPSPTAKDIDDPIDLPPVVPIVNGILGLRYSPSENVALNVDGGLRSALYVGMSVDIFFR